VAGEGHQHSSELARWDQAYLGTGDTGARFTALAAPLSASSIPFSIVGSPTAISPAWSAASS
jgi:hypothetical protein